MGKTRIAFIGAGELAKIVHYPSLAAMDDVEIVALCDLMPEKAQAVAEKFNVPKTYQNYRQMVEETAPDAVYVVMPPHHIYDPTAWCLSQGMNVFIDKPPGVTVVQTRNLANLAEKHNCITEVGFQRRYSPVMQKARARLLERGPLVHCVAFYNKTYLDGPYYEGAIDILTCDAIHAVDNLRWMCGGEIVSVASDVRMIGGKDYHNTFHALVKFSSGCTGILLTSWRTGFYRFAVEMHGDLASALVEINAKATYHEHGAEPEVWDPKEVGGGKEDMIYFSGFFAENRHFIDCVRDKVQPLSHFGDAVKSMELVQRIYQGQI